jgi:spore germination protein YaaH
LPSPTSPTSPVSTDSTDAGVAGVEPTATPKATRRRHITIGALAAVLAVVLAAGVLIAGRDSAPPPKPDIPLDAWAPYWALDASLPAASKRLPSMREVSPFWFRATGAGDITVDPNADPQKTKDFIDAASGSGAAIVPSIVDALPAGGMAAILADPATRTQHVDAIAAFAKAGNYDGIDIDYERFAFSDLRDTWAATRPNWVAFITELGARLHADGRSLSVSVPPIYDAGRTDASGYWVYDYGAIAPHVDRIRIMAYDYSVDKPGPISPIDWVESTITGAVDAVGSPDKLVLGIPAYGRNWPASISGTCPATAEGRTTVTARTVDDLIAKRGATAVFDEATAESSFSYPLVVDDGTTACTQTREVHFVDAAGVRARMDLARKHRLNGVSLWAFGFDDDAVWNAILPTVADPSATTTLP